MPSSNDDLQALAAAAERSAGNGEAVSEAVRLVARNRPETLLPVARAVDAYDRAARRLQRALETEIEKALEWERFLDEHPELTA